MNLRIFNFIFQIIFYLLLNIFFVQSIKASSSSIDEFPQNNLEKKLNSPNIQEDLYLLGAGDSLIFSVIGAEELRINTKIYNDGKAIIPLLGPVKLKGHTIPSASRYLETNCSSRLMCI